MAQRDIGYAYQGLLFPFYLSQSQLQIIDAAISTPEEVDLCHCHCCRLGRSLAYALFSCLVLQSVPMPESFSSITTVVHRDATPSYPSTLASEPLTAAISFCLSPLSRRLRLICFSCVHSVLVLFDLRGCRTSSSLAVLSLVP